MTRKNIGTRRSRRSPRIASQLTALLVAVTVPATALAGSFAVMSYNVRGIPPPAIEDRSAQIAAIAPRLEDFHTAAAPYVGIPSVVGLQEVFSQSYYNVLTNPLTVSYPYVTAKDTGGPVGIGDGLVLLSDFPINGFVRTEWDHCFGLLDQFGGDCDTNKGFSYGRVFLEANVFVDVYTLHADAGQDEGSRIARRSNILQLVEAINTNSPDGIPVIVLGDTNSLYTRQGNDNIQSLISGTGVADVWVQLRRSGIVPTEGDAIDADCPTNPGSGECELVDKIFYRDGSALALAPQSYAALKAMFSDNQGEELSDHTPVAVTFDYALVTTTTTTTSPTSTSTSTSTTTLPERPCGDPVALVAKFSTTGPDGTGESRAVVAGDALFVLRAAVGSNDCPLCTCDVNNNAAVSAVDALIVLKKAVGQDVPLNCPAC
jgi:hypothetical protein